MSERDAWTVLGLVPGATADEVAAAYRQAAKKAHPDVGGSRQEWDELSEAYTLLTAGGHFTVDPSDPVVNKPTVFERVEQRWKQLSVPARLGILGGVGTAAGIGIGIPVWNEVMDITGFWTVAATIVGYPAAWWAWWMLQQFRRPAVRPMRWYMVRVPEDKAGQDKLLAFIQRESEAADRKRKTA